MPDSIKGFRYVQINTSYFKLVIGVKWFVNFVCSWEKLMHRWITGSEASLIAIKEFIVLQMFKKRVKDNFFKHFATSRQEWHLSVITYYFFVVFFMNWGNICLFPFIWKTFIYYTFVKKDMQRFLDWRCAQL